MQHNIYKVYMNVFNSNITNSQKCENKMDIIMHVCNSNTWGIKAGGLGV